MLSATPSPSCRRHEGADRGSATLEMTILIPVALLVLVGIIQGAIWLHASNVAHLAATNALTAARVQDGTSGAGHAAGESTIDQAGSNALTGTAVSVTRGAVTVTVTVTGHAPTFIPGWHPPIRQTVTGPAERVTQP